MLRQLYRAALNLQLSSCHVPARSMIAASDLVAGHSSSFATSPAEVLDSGQSFGTKVTYPDRGDEHGRSPVIVLLGWLHGADKHLSKYSSFYDQHGCITIRIPVVAMPLLFGRNLDAGRHLLGLLLHERFLGRDVVFHVFSNGGCSILTQIRLLLESEPYAYHGVSIRGTIFDSAPARFRWRASIRAYTAHIDDPFLLRAWQVSALVRLAALAILRQFIVLTGARSPYLYEQLRTSACRQPELYLYSKADAITYHKDVADFAANRRKVGVDASEVCWEDSAHVAHMPAHRDEYVQRCLSFVDRCCLPSRSRL